MNAIVKDKNTQETIATVQTNHSMSIADVLSTAGLDVNDYDFNDLVLSVEAEIADPMFTQWDLTDPSQGNAEGY